MGFGGISSDAAVWPRCEGKPGLLWYSAVVGSGTLSSAFSSSPIAATLAKAGNAYYGNAPVWDALYHGYEPIKDASGAIIGVYFVGYRK